MEPGHYREVLEMMRKLGKMRLRFIASMGGTAREFHVLNLIAGLCPGPDGTMPGIRASEIGAAAGMSKPAVSQMLNLMENRGLVERAPARSDRRVVYVRLTENGKELHGRLEKSFEATLDRITGELGPRDTAELLRLFGRLGDIFEKIGEEEIGRTKQTRPRN